MIRKQEKFMRDVEWIKASFALLSEKMSKREGV
jgi:hypothetical protein